MITIILLLTSISLLVLLIGFLDIHLPFIISKARAIAKYSPGKKINPHQQKKSDKRIILYKKAHIGFIDIDKPS